MTQDRIKIENLEIYAHHGVYAEETKLGQTFFVNAVLYTDITRAGQADDIALSTNYGEVCLFIRDYLTEHTFRLLEAAAENLAARLLLSFPKITALDLEIRKPSAPIPLPFQSVSVEIHRSWRRAYVAFGSNMGKKEQYLSEAIASVRKNPACRIKAVSDYYKTAPYGDVEQADFLNGVFCMETLYGPEALLDFLQSLEETAGRVRDVHWGPRTLDLDILLYENEILETDRLRIPHADMENRDFVLTPLCEIAPNLRHPVSGKTVRELLLELPKKNLSGGNVL